MITFEEIIDRNTIIMNIDKQGYYDFDSVKKNFYKVLDVLGAFDNKDICALLLFV